MIKVLLLTHAELAEGFQSAVNLIIGKQPCFEVLGLKLGQSLEEYADIMHKKAESMASVDGTLIFVDVFGGTPGNTAGKLLLEKWPYSASLFGCIAGVNLSLLMEALTMRESMDLAALKSHLMALFPETVVDMETALHLQPQ